MHTRDQTRRDFIHGAASVAGAVAFVGCDLLDAIMRMPRARRAAARSWSAASA